jgi:hypothetical protein
VLVQQDNRSLYLASIFWDVNFEAIDYDIKATFAMQRVFERCDVPDIRACGRYYLE